MFHQSVLRAPRADARLSQRFDESFPRFVPPADAPRAASAQAGTAVRRATIDAWLLTLPGDVRPYRLASQLDRIALNLVARWAHASVAVAYIDEVLSEQSGARAWVAVEVIAELRALREYLRSPRSRERHFSRLGARMAGALGTGAGVA